MPQNPELHLSLGHALKTQGRRSEAELEYREAVRLRPGFGDAYWSLANLKTYRFTDDELATMREQVDARTHSRWSTATTCVSRWARRSRTRATIAESFKFYERGNALKKIECRYGQS